jgi:O-methyltransferase involved in polyketide biosynthesis
VLENKRWGAPGCTNFIDARTKWFDNHVLAALADGIQQVQQSTEHNG